MKELDISEKQDLSIAVMHLISVEEHMAFTAMKTKKKEYLEIQAEVRKLRVKLLKKLLVNTEGELWCISKHLLSATMRLIETSAKYMSIDKKQAEELMKQAFEVYTLFWFLQNLGDDNDRKPAKKSQKMEK